MVSELVAAAERAGDVRPDVDPALASRLLFGLVNSLTEWYRPDGGLAAADLADAVVTDRLRRVADPPPGVRSTPTG